MMQSRTLSRFFMLALLSSSFLMEAKKVNISNPEEFKKLLDNKEVAVVKFYANWCGACKMVADSFDQVANDPEFDHYTFAYVDADKNGELMHRQGVTGLPTFVYLENGAVKSKDVGVNNPTTFAQDLKKALRTLKVAQSSTQSHVDAQMPEGQPAPETATPETAAPSAPMPVAPEVAPAPTAMPEVAAAPAPAPAPTPAPAPSYPATEEGFLAKIQGFLAMIFVKIKDLLMSIVNWVKGLFGR